MFKLNYTYRFLLIIFFFSSFQTVLKAQIDTAFWFVAPEVTVGHVDRPIYLRLTASTNPATVTISYPARPWITALTRVIAANSTVNVDMTPYIDSLENKPANTILRYGIFIKATNLITAYYEVAGTNNPDIFTLKGAQALGLDFYIPGQNQYPNKNGLNPLPFNAVDIVATVNNTQVTIIPNHAVVGHATGVPYTITLNKGQTYSVVATSQTGANHLAGSRIYSNKPIAITVSDDSVIPTGFGCYDLQGEQIVPVSILGQDYVAIKGSLNFNDWVFVIGAYPNTDVFLNGSSSSSANISAGGIYAYQFAPAILYIQTSRPAYVWHVSGFGCEMGATLLPSIKCTGSNTVSVTRTTNEYFGVNMITSATAKNSFKLNGSSGIINGTSFSAVPGTSNNYWAARIDLSSNVTVGAANTISNTTGLFHLGVIHGGASSGCRYGYFSGFSNLYLGPDGLICSADTLTLDGGDFKDSYHWSTGDTVRKIKVFYTDTFWVETVQNTCTLRDTIIIRALPSPHSKFNIISDTAKCINENVFVFQNLSTISSGTLSHLWKFGDNTTSSAVHPNHTYTSPGTFTVKLIVTSLDGCKDSFQKKVVVFPKPNVVFTINDSTQCLQTNNFILSNNSTISTGTITYFWNFDDATTSTQTNPSHIYPVYDTFKLKLVVTSDLNCKDSLIKTTYVFPMPVAGFNVNDTTQCFTGNQFIFSNSSTIPYGTNNYKWFFGDTSTSFTKNPTHNYIIPDTFHVSLITSSANGCADTAYLTNYVFPQPVVKFSLNDSSQCLSNNQVAFTNLTTIQAGTMSFIWSLGDGDTSHKTNLTHKYLTHDTFLVRLNAFSTYGCTDSASKKIYIFPMPDAAFSVNDTDQCLRGNNFIFTNNSTIPSGSLSHFWILGDFNFSFNVNLAHSYLTFDTFQIKLTVTSPFGCKDTLIKSVIVFPMPQTSYTIIDSAQCFQNNQFIFNNNSTIPSGSVSYLWNYGDNTTSLDTNTSHHYFVDDTFTVKLKTISNFACTDSFIRKIIVFPMPVSNFSINDTDQCFKGNRFVFINLSTIHSGTKNFNWDLGDGSTSTSTNQLHNYASDDTFKVKLICTSAFACQDSMIKTIYVRPSPKVNFVINDTGQCFSNNNFIFTNLSIINSGTQTFKWYLGDGNTANTVGTSYQYLSPGTYQVKLKAISDVGCSDSLSVPVVVYPMPIADFAISDSIQCFKANQFSFSNNSSISSGSISYLWNFGDSVTSVLTNPFHSYLYDNSFPVKLIVSSGLGCKDSMQKNNFVFPSPVAKFSINDTSQCLLNNRVVFKNNSSIHLGTIASFWTIGDGDFETASDSFIHAYTGYDTFTVKLIVTSNLGCLDSISKLVYIHPMPVADFSIDDSSQCLSGNLFNFKNLTSIPYGNLGYGWKFGDGNSSLLKDISHSYGTIGNYLTSLIINSGMNCKDSFSLPLSVHPMPDARFVYSLACLEDTMNFTNTSIIPAPDKIVFWDWSFGDGHVSSLENPPHFYTNPGLFTVNLVVTSDNQCKNSVNNQVKVNEHVIANVITRATVEDDQSILIEWEPINVGIPRDYVLERSLNDFYFSKIKTFNMGILDYYDPGLYVNEVSYVYRMKIIDSCDFNSPYSNFAKTILLTSEKNTIHPMLHWTPYISWSLGIQQYLIQVRDDILGIFYEVGSTDTDTFFTDNQTHLNQLEYCYRIIALRPDGIQSVSNVACIPTPFNIWVPNSFSPNGDALNDLFEIRGTYIMGFQMTIFNRWGVQVYSSNNIDESWDGNYSGQLCPPGYYYYRILAQGTKGQAKNISGMVLLLR